MAMDAAATSAVLVIGNEVLSGRTQDANLGFLAARLADLGIPVVEARVVPDEEAVIVEAVNALRARVTYVFTTGGIGPTHDDITAAAIAKAFGVPVVRDPEAERRLRVHYGNGFVNAARLKMAEVPEGAALIDNPVSTAPGFRIGNVFVLAGVPAIARAMFDALAPGLAGGPPVVSRTVPCSIPEGEFAAALTDVQSHYAGVSIGSYPYFRAGKVGVSLVIRGTDLQAVDRAAAEVEDMVRSLGGEPLV
jgi:molybdenum cofactor synthesis domain-containing protein